MYQPFYENIVSCLNDYFRLLGIIDYIQMKCNLDLSFKFIKQEVVQSKKFILLVIKLLLYYLWDLENVNDYINSQVYKNK